MAKNITMWGTIGVLLALFGVIFTMPIILNKEYLFALPITALSVVGGVILIAWSLSK